MKTFIKFVALLIALMTAFLIVLLFCRGCYNEADRVRSNLSKEADAFNCVRRVTIVDCITSEVLFQCEGKISITADTVDNQLEILIEEEGGTYKKAIIGLSDNVTYLVEDIYSSYVNPYQYTIMWNPKMVLPFDAKLSD